MVRRMSKQQREQQQRDALYKRVCDIMAGACQGDDPAADDYFVSAVVLPGIVRGIMVRLLPGNYAEHQAFLTSIRNADSYDNAKTLTDFLFANGIRA